MARAAKVSSGRDARREAILDVAEAVFFDEGFDVASMSMIAARVGGSKGTLYNYFKNKQDLFAACVERHCVWQSEAMFALLREASGGPAKTLHAAGERYLAMILSDENVRRFRVITAAAERSPEIGRIFYESGPRNGAARVTDYIARAHAAGELDAPDPDEAAHHFLALCSNRLHKARLTNFIAAPSGAEIAAEVAAAVRVFLAAYGPKT